METLPPTTPLKDLNLGTLVFDKRNLIKIDSNMTVEEALYVLYRENILAVPVCDPETEEIIAILTTFDFVAYFSFESFKVGEEAEADAFSLFESANIHVSELLQKCKEKEKIWKFNAKDQIEKVLLPMSKGIHRVLVDINNGEGKPQYRMLTQTDLIRFLTAYSCFNQNQSPLNIEDNIKKLNFINTENQLKTAREKTRALDVLRLMYHHQVHAIPLVNSEGKLTATLSPSDLRGLRSYQFKSILLPAIEFLLIKKGLSARRCITCTENNTLSDVITKLVINKVHRVWIVNEMFHPIGVISLSDIIAKFVV